MTERPGSSEESGFANEYARMGDAELLKIAAAYDSLVEPAQGALRVEFARRKMEPPLVEDDKDEGTLVSEPLVTLRSYSDVSQAMVPRTVLESAGIYCFLRDENFVRVDWGAGIALGGVRLQVRPEDAREAESVLSQPIPESIEYQGTEKWLQPRCPRCGSIDVAAPLLSDLRPPVRPGEDAWRCCTCGCRWSEDGKDAFEVGGMWKGSSDLPWTCGH